MRTSTLALIALTSLAACSFSDSSGSLSDSVSSPFELVSSLSAGVSSDSAYRDDVSDHTRTVLALGGSAADVSAGLGTIARAHGISDWQASDSTYLGVGRGIAKAAAGDGALVAAQASLATCERRKALMQAGFHAADAE